MGQTATIGQPRRLAREDGGRALVAGEFAGVCVRAVRQRRSQLEDCQSAAKDDTQAMTIAALEREILALPASSRVRIAEKILASVDDFATQGIANAWENELERRTKEIRQGRAQGIPAGKVAVEARRKLNEARRLSSARRK